MRGRAAGRAVACALLLTVERHAYAAPSERHPPETTVAAGAIHLHVEREGSGPPLVLLPIGPGIDHAYFHPYLSALAPWRTVVYLDPRGCGRSEAGPGDALTLQQMVADLEEVRRSLGAPRLDLLGHGLGAAVAILYADRYPARVDRMVILGAGPLAASFLDSPGLVATPEMRSALEAAEEDRYLSPDGKLRERLRIVAPLLFRRLTDRAFQRAFVDQITFSAAVRAALAPRLDADAPALQAALAALKSPVLLMQGRFDPTATPEQAEQLRSLIRSARLEILDDSGSFPFAEQPVEFLKLVKGFLGVSDSVKAADGAGGGI